MKRSTPSKRNNLNALIKDEVVKRFEDVVKEEIRRHNDAISKSNEDLEHVKKLFEDHKKELVALKEENVSAYMRTQTIFQQEVERMENNFEDQRRLIKEGLKKIDKALMELMDKADEFLSISVMSDYEKKNEKRHVENEKKVASVVSYVDNQNHALKEEVANEISSLQESNVKEFMYMREDLSEMKQNLTTNIIDAVGLQRMMKIDERTLNVIEKKIENIYTLIGRTKAGGQVHAF